MYDHEHKDVSWSITIHLICIIYISIFVKFFWFLMTNKSDLVELNYISQAVEDLNVWGLTNIVELSTISTASHGITGILFLIMVILVNYFKAPEVR